MHTCRDVRKSTHFSWYVYHHYYYQYYYYHHHQGKNFVHQLTLIFDVIGSPKPSDVAHITNPQAKKFLESQGNKKRQSLSKLYPAASSEALEILSSLLIFNPDDRCTVDEALACDFLSDLDKHHEPLSLSLVYPEVSSEFEFDFEREDVSRQHLKALIKREADSFKAEKYTNTNTNTYDTNYDNTTKATSTTATKNAIISNPKTSTNTNTSSLNKRSNRYNDNPVLADSTTTDTDEEKMRLIKALLDSKKPSTKFTSANSIGHTISRRQGLDNDKGISATSTSHTTSRRHGLDDDKGMAYLTSTYKHADDTTSNSGRPVSAPKAKPATSTNLSRPITAATAATSTTAKSSTRLNSASNNSSTSKTFRSKGTVPQSPKFSTLSWQKTQYPVPNNTTTTTNTTTGTTRLAGIGIAGTITTRSKSAGTITTNTNH